MATEKDIELIEDYLSDKLSAEEKLAFEQRLKNEAEFADYFSFVNDLKLSSKEFRKTELKEKLKKIVSESLSSETSTNTFKKYFAIAASVIAIVGLAAFFYWMQSKGNNGRDNVADHKSETIQEINKIITNSKNKTKQYSINSIGAGYGYSESDSIAENKIPVLIINSEKYNNHYLYRDTLFLFLGSEDGLQLYTIGSKPDYLYFKIQTERYYAIGLKSRPEISPIEIVKDSTLINLLK